MSFEFINQSIENIYVINSTSHLDERGLVVELFKSEDFKNSPIDFSFKQVNYSYSKYKTLRGLHFQYGQDAQSKIISVQYGSIVDIVVDLRKSSETFGKYLKFNLDSPSKLLYVPKGFAHGFVVISDFAIVTYFLDEIYNPKSQGGVIWNDNTLNIDWGIDFEPILSHKDKLLPQLSEIQL